MNEYISKGKNIGIQLAIENDLQSVNDQYKKIDFVSNTLGNKFITILSYIYNFVGIDRILLSYIRR